MYKPIIVCTFLLEKYSLKLSIGPHPDIVLTAHFCSNRIRLRFLPDVPSQTTRSYLLCDSNSAGRQFLA